MERKLIIAVVRPFLLDKLVVAFENIENFPGITVTEAHGFGGRFGTRRSIRARSQALQQRIQNLAHYSSDRAWRFCDLRNASLDLQKGE